MTEQDHVLRLLSEGENLTIEALDGTETIAKAEKVFRSTDSDFRNWGLDKCGQVTKEVKVDVHEMVEDVTFKQIFTSINTDLDKVCMTQHQIIRFCEKYSDWLIQEGYGTSFLMKENNEYLVVLVFVSPVGLMVSVFHFEYGLVCLGGEYHHRVVSPQLVLSGK